MLFFGLLTVWPSYAMTMVKDTGFYALFLLFNVALVKLSKGIDYNGKVDKYIFLLSGTGIILFRNNGIHTIMLSFPLLLLMRKKQIAFLTGKQIANDFVPNVSKEAEQNTKS